MQSCGCLIPNLSVCLFFLFFSCFSVKPLLELIRFYFLLEITSIEIFSEYSLEKMITRIGMLHIDGEEFGSNDRNVTFSALLSHLIFSRAHLPGGIIRRISLVNRYKV